jgi:hypothetical protein
MGFIYVSVCKIKSVMVGRGKAMMKSHFCRCFRMSEQLLGELESLRVSVNNDYVKLFKE